MPNPEAAGSSPAEMIRFLLKHGMTQRTIADRIGADQSTVSRILSGAIGQPSYGSAKKLEELCSLIQQYGRLPR